MLEYLEDLIDNDPAEEFPRSVQASGRYAHRTGDSLLDEWQEKAATGEVIDFGEAFTSEEARKQFETAKAASRSRHQLKTTAAPLPDEIHDDYTGGR